MRMQRDCSSILLISMPFAGVEIPSIQLALLESYLKERDVEIETRHLYLKAADFYGLKNYNTLIHPPNDSYTSQMVFSKYVFPDYWEKNIERFKEYYNRISKEQTFEEYVKKTDNFYNFVISNIDWGRYDIIGFTLNYGQFLPSLAVAKKIKEFYPNKKIVFGGSRTTGELGINTLKIFPYVDFVVSGEGEEALYRLSIQSANYDQIPNLIYRKDGEIVFNNTTSQMNLNLLPIPLYDDFYKELNSVSAILKEYFSYQGRLPVEISRGCWWNKCTFCNLNIQYKGYREKDVDRIVEEIDFLSDKYEILSFHIVSNILLLKNMGVLCKKLMELGKDFSFFAETRAGRLKSFDYALLKKAGFNVIQTGIESFSSSYLKKMNKGVGVIDNIAALKFCMENGITNEYNLIVDYPNEELIDFEETRRNVELIEDYIDPPNLCNLRVLYGSPIYCNRERFGIKELDFFEIDKIMFPREILEKGISFVYSFKVKEKS
ncbi:MAG TPA: RiPP maturation radical SAM protein 1, partial [Thermoplasmatales archaeon]|nr:RiPP maturation radical SAM protein 1 [Thermoplasmatales archaeon]